MSRFKKGDVVVYDDMECTITGWDDINEEHILETPAGEEISVADDQIKTVEEMTSEKHKSVKGPSSEKGDIPNTQTVSPKASGKAPVKDSDNENGVGQYESKLTRFSRRRAEATAEAELTEEKEQQGSETVAKKDDKLEEQKKLLDETAAGDLIKAKPSGATGVMQSTMVASTIKALYSMSGDDQIKFYDKMIAQYGKNKDWGVGDVSGKNKGTITAKKSSASGEVHDSVKDHQKPQVVKDDLQIILGDDENLSGELKLKMETLFEAAVTIRVAEKMEELEEDYTTSFETELETAIVEITENVDKFLTYAIDDWVEKNEVAIENSLQMELSNSFMSGLRDLFAEHCVNVPDDQVDIVEVLSTKVEELESDLNEQVKANMKLVETLEEYGAEEIFAEMAEGMVLTQAEKFRTLAESVEFEGNDDEYREKLNIIKEHHFSSKTTPAKSTLNKDVIEEEVEETSDPLEDKPTDQMQRYADAISRTIKR